MLGRGRPFVLELPNALFSQPTASDLLALADQINVGAQGQIVVRDLAMVTRSSVAQLREGEEAKEKTYSYAALAHPAPHRHAARACSVTPDRGRVQ